jgi:XTP/dITP diphosphohydrolase
VRTQRLILASSNVGKLQELAALLAPLGFELAPQRDLGIESPPETGATFLENALIKARHAARRGLPAIADDSGIEVDALQGAPGVRSARFAGEHASEGENLQKLLQALADVPPARRGARYRCVIALVRAPEDAAPLIAQGAWEGQIAEQARGTGGFGYDPIFVPTGSARSAAELTAPEKNAVSHRALALRALIAQLHAAVAFNGGTS